MNQHDRQLIVNVLEQGFRHVLGDAGLYSWRMFPHPKDSDKFQLDVYPVSPELSESILSWNIDPAYSVRQVIEEVSVQFAHYIATREEQLKFKILKNRDFGPFPRQLS